MRKIVIDHKGKEDLYVSHGAWWISGELEDLLGTSEAVIVSKDHLVEFKIREGENPVKRGVRRDLSWDKSMTIHYLEDGEYEVEVVGVEKPCLGFFWTDLEEYDNLLGGYPIMRGGG